MLTTDSLPLVMELRLPTPSAVISRSFAVARELLSSCCKCFHLRNMLQIISPADGIRRFVEISRKDTECCAECHCPGPVHASTALSRSRCTDLGPIWLCSTDKNNWFVLKKNFKRCKNNKVTVYSFTSFPVLSGPCLLRFMSPLRGNRAYILW